MNTYFDSSAVLGTRREGKRNYLVTMMGSLPFGVYRRPPVTIWTQASMRTAPSCLLGNKPLVKLLWV
jgi:hypothetical protein